ncbi:TPA: LamG domain-containing protein, partial [Candidatus Poribacteria bacterium]|nr:LamG domain-containing protein [Candidatus Poribacteria bacterium]
MGGSSAEVDLKTAAGIWLFEQGAGNQAKDSSENRNHGKLMNGPKWVKGKFGKALEFDGEDDTVVSGSNLGISGNDERTIVFWIKPASSEGFQLIVAWGQTGAQKAYWAEYNGNQGGPNTIRVCGYDGDIYTKSKLLPLNQWHHVAAVYPGKVSETKLYYNGVSQEILLWGEEALNTVDTPVTIGDAPFLHGINRRAFKGAIDEVVIFSVAL